MTNEPGCGKVCHAGLVAAPTAKAKTKKQTMLKCFIWLMQFYSTIEAKPLLAFIYGFACSDQTPDSENHQD
jgi:hypothetical protein